MNVPNDAQENALIDILCPYRGCNVVEAKALEARHLE